ncbi:MAG: hypothetical protein P4M12_00105 [Gammaproteobacteria bacterium]|nr:hypothetical protein [Gammaproteobacteria bacterium]
MSGPRRVAKIEEDKIILDNANKAIKFQFDNAQLQQSNKDLKNELEKLANFPHEQAKLKDVEKKLNEKKIEFEVIEKKLLALEQAEIDKKNPEVFEAMKKAFEESNNKLSTSSTSKIGSTLNSDDKLAVFKKVFYREKGVKYVIGQPQNPNLPTYKQLVNNSKNFTNRNEVGLLLYDAKRLEADMHVLNDSYTTLVKQQNPPDMKIISGKTNELNDAYKIAKDSNHLLQDDLNALLKEVITYRNQTDNKDKIKYTDAMIKVLLEIKDISKDQMTAINSVLEKKGALNKDDQAILMSAVNVRNFPAEGMENNGSIKMISMQAIYDTKLKAPLSDARHNLGKKSGVFLNRGAEALDKINQIITRIDEKIAHKPQVSLNKSR